MDCSQCHSANLDSRRYCHKCGSKLSASCGRCAFLNQITDAFCGGCGVALREAQTEEHPPVSHASSEKSVALRVLSSSEVSELVSASRLSPKVVSTHVSQDELDRLFGAQ